MPYYKYKNETLKSIRDLAVVIGLHPSKCWRLVSEGIIESPTTPAGQRHYYDPKQVENIIKQVSRLRKSGKLD